MPKTIIDGFKIDLYYKNIKRINITLLPPNGDIRVSVPLLTSLKQVENFIALKHNWIVLNQQKIRARKNIFNKSFSEGALHPLWGELIPISYADKNSILFLSSNNSLLELNSIYRLQIKTKAPPLFDKWASIMNVSINEWRIKKMKTRWGSCNVLDKRIWLNLKLAAFPLSCLEFIIVHELCHLIERPHSKHFYSLMDTYLPSWRESKNILSSFNID